MRSTTISASQSLAARQPISACSAVTSGGARKPPIEVPMVTTPKAVPRRRANHLAAKVCPASGPASSSPATMSVPYTRFRCHSAPARPASSSPAARHRAPAMIRPRSDSRSTARPASGESSPMATCRVMNTVITSLRPTLNSADQGATQKVNE